MLVTLYGAYPLIPCSLRRCQRRNCDSERPTGCRTAACQQHLNDFREFFDAIVTTQRHTIVIGRGPPQRPNSPRSLPRRSHSPTRNTRQGFPRPDLHRFTPPNQGCQPLYAHIHAPTCRFPTTTRQRLHSSGRHVCYRTIQYAAWSLPLSLASPSDSRSETCRSSCYYYAELEHCGYRRRCPFHSI